jgi:hypothetical protein
MVTDGKICIKNEFVSINLSDRENVGAEGNARGKNDCMI